MPTPEEILKRIESRKNNDFLGFEINEYIVFLPYKLAKPYLKKDTKKKEWNPPVLTKDYMLQKMKDYMPFAWEKANNCRGFSANRSIEHYIAWVWLAGDTGLSATIEKEYDNNYEYYGKPILEKICKHYNWDYKEWDNRIRTNNG